MTESNLRQSLQNYGFEEKEVLVYLALVKKVEATALEISKATKLPRTSVYNKLEGLKARGLISSYKRNNIARYTPESLNKLLQIHKDKEKIIESIIPQIRSLSHQDELIPNARLYTGKEGMKIVFEDILETLATEPQKELLASFDPDLLKHLPKYFPEWLNRRKNMGVYTKLIVPYNKITPEYAKSNSHRETRSMPEMMPLECCMDIYGNKIAFFSFKNDELYSVIIESETMVMMFRQFFGFMWNMLGEKSKI